VAECRNLKVTPHVAYNLERLGGNAIDARTTQRSNGAKSLTPADKTKLVFNRYGNQYFLSLVGVNGETLGHQLPKSSRKKEVARDMARSLTQERVEVLATFSSCDDEYSKVKKGACKMCPSFLLALNWKQSWDTNSVCRSSAGRCS
jgi:hypothetical protein